MVGEFLKRDTAIGVENAQVILLRGAGQPLDALPSSVIPTFLAYVSIFLVESASHSCEGQD